MKIVLTGATGFIGTKLSARLESEGHTVHGVGRLTPRQDVLEGSGAIVHLAGEPVAQRWNKEIKKKIRASRTEGTRQLVETIAKLRERPRVLVSASAIGYYGDRGEEKLTEASAPGKGFLPEVCVEWEEESRRAEKLGLRVVCIRIGIVLGKEGGALKQMLPAFRLGGGGPLGSGKQWMSWIHVTDLVSLFADAVRSDTFASAVNGVAPLPVRNSDFAKTLGSTLGRPAILPVPGFALKLLFGEMAGVVLSSQHVLPDVAAKAGFQFRYPELGGALKEIV